MHSFYDSSDNYNGEKLYIHASLEDFRNGTGTLVREIILAYNYDNHGNWIYRSASHNGVPGTTTRRIITYYLDSTEVITE